MNIAYLVNQYPAISVSFIRREISGVEEAGIRVSRYSIRSSAAGLVDPADKAEALKTQIVLDIGLLSLFGYFIGTAFQRPAAWLACFKNMLQLSSASDQSLFHHLAYMAEACVLLNWFRRDGIDHVHVHFGTNPSAVAMLCHILGGPTYSFTVHGPEEFDKPISLSLSAKIERAKFVVGVSNFGRSQLYRWCSHKHWDKIHIVHCGLDKSFLEYDSPVSIPAQAKFVCVARLSEQKGHLLLLESVKRLASSGYTFKVVLVGDGYLRPELEALIAKWKLEDFVELIGWASGSTVREKMLESRALVLPSFAEGLPVVIMESLALKRPVISTCIAGIPELLGNNSCGWLITAGSVEALTEAMTQAIHLSTDALEAMGQAGAERVAKDHNAAIEAQKLVKLFQNTLERASVAESPQKTNTATANFATEARAAQKL